ncbi:natural product biosynthesis luciferase-like monooxygenase protein [Streptomyces canus]|uniref:MupA/Atu3671 family FMN-dependent luciferase-like monooxygenase n=1 Tax=Streptomyces canus TaxID=58343 RepID=UPI002786EC25|nr:MupA/Atu3671 family FMN-dependent luciferase-like monooxygenase [Streptomyces canus]MDQ0601386.1 natural product biosynthesis luciferase-like monooxygenase protein [Streptomyces canus]
MSPGTAADRAAALSRRLDEQLARARQGAADPAPPAPSVHGPRVTLPHDSGMAGAGATDTQRTHAAGLARRLAERTRASKELAQSRRSVLADSRAVVGFRRSTKETLYPLAARDARGAHLTDIDGNTYTDITMGFGSLLLGHEPSCVTEAVRAHLDGGLRFGPRPVEAGEVAQLLAEFTGMERVAFAASGTEANSAAIRLARAATGRDRIVMFRGSYHGHIDTVLGRPGPGDGAVPVSRGIPDSAVAELIVLEYGSQEALTTIEALGDRIAAVLVEPVQCRNPALRPVAFLRELRELTRRRGIVLLFDEMLTGLRPHPRGAQHHFGVVPDLATYGKALGSGFPVGAIAGRADIMDGVDGGFWRYGDESRPTAETTFFGGTYLQHPLSMAAAKAVLTHLAAEGPGLQERLNARTDALADDLNRFFTDEEFPLELSHFGSMFRFVHRADMELLYQHLLLRGIYVWEWRSFYLSTAHTDTDTERVADAVKGSLRELRQAGFFPTSRRTTARVRAEHRAKRPDFGVYFFGDYPDADSTSAYDRLVDTARFADERGFSSLWLPERHFHSFGGLFPNPAVLAASLARETSRIRLNAGSVVLPLHDPVRVAEEWSVVDNLSGGRVGLGCATGWHAQDFALHPDRFERRKEIAFAHLDDVTTLWRGGAVRRVTGEGEPVDVTIHPRPVQELPPMFLATSGRRASYEEAGRRGLGIVTNLMGQTVAELADNIRHFRKAREQHGLDPDTGRVTVLLHTYLGTDHATARAEALEPMSRYLRSSLQMRSAASALGAGPEDVATASEDDLDYLFRRAYDRYCDERALIGTPESCAPLVKTLHEAGVDEIAALVDFGIPAERMRAGLENLDALRRRTSGAAPGGVGAEGALPPSAGVVEEALRLGAGVVEEALRPGAGVEQAGPPGRSTQKAVPPSAGTAVTVPPDVRAAEAVLPDAGTVEEAVPPGRSTQKAVPPSAGTAVTVPPDVRAAEAVLPDAGTVEEAVPPGRSTQKAVPPGAGTAVTVPPDVRAAEAVLPGRSTLEALPPSRSTDKTVPPDVSAAEAVLPDAGTVEALPPSRSTDKTVPPDVSAAEAVLPDAGTVEALPPSRSTDKTVPPGADAADSVPPGAGAAVAVPPGGCAVDVVGRDSASAHRRVVGRRGSADGVGGPPGTVRRGPATDAQRRLWLAARLIADPAAYNEIQSVRLRGPLSERALRTAVAGLVEWHAGLRTVFRAAGDTVEQVVRPDLRPELTVTDVDGPEAVAAVLREESGRPYDLAEGPLFTPRLLRLAADDHVLVLGLHHIITDAHSAGLLAADLEELYRASVEDRDPVFAAPAGTTLDEPRAAQAPAHLDEPASATLTGTAPIGPQTAHAPAHLHEPQPGRHPSTPEQPHLPASDHREPAFVTPTGTIPTGPRAAHTPPHPNEPQPGHHPTTPDGPPTGYDPADLEWWRGYLDPLPPAPALPTDRPRGRRVAGRGAAEEVFWGAGRAGRLREWSGRQGVTLFSTLLTAWQLVLRERSGQDEFVVGSTFGRRRPGTEHTVGFHVAVLPLKASLTDTTGLRDAVRATRDALFAADAHQHVDVDALLAAVNPAPGHPRPLVTVSADLDGAPLSRLRLPGLTTEQIPGGTESAPLELALAALDTRDGLRLRIRYDADLYDASTVRGLLADLDRVLEAMADGRAVTVADTKPAAGPAANHPEAPAPRESETLRTLWSSVLGTDDVSDSADFFDLGGSSIAAIRLHNRVRDALGVEFSLADFFAEPTLGALIRSLTGSGTAEVAEVAGVAEDVVDRAPVTEQQARMLAAQPALPRPQVYNVPTRIRLTGPVDTDALRTALTGLVRRHHSLRTRYVRDGEGAWWQEVVDVAPPPLRIVDYSRLPAERAAQRADQACRAAADEPFDLTRPTLPRLRLLRVAPDEWVLMFVVHHICTDGWSHGVLLGELAALYTAAATGTAPTLSAPSAQPADHARRQLARRGGTERTRRAAHFVDHLTGVPTRLEVPTDRPRSGHLSGDGDTVRAHAPAELRGRVERFAAIHRVTPFAVAAAALGVTVARLSGRRDLLVGVPYANRDGSDTETLVSLVSTNMPVRIRVKPEETCAELVARTGSETLAAMANVLPTAEVWQALREAGVREVPEVVSCLLVFQNTDDVEIEIPGLGVDVDDVAPPAARTELTFGLTPRRDPSLGYRAYVEYSADLWDRKSAERILGSYLSALDDLCAEPGRTVGELLAPTTSGEA